MLDTLTMEAVVLLTFHVFSTQTAAEFYEVVEKWFDDVIPSAARDLLWLADVENKSRFFSPAESAGLQNDIITDFSTTF